MVKFRKLKFKHARKAIEMSKRDEATGDDIEIESLSFLISLVEEWDFVDVDTGEPLPVDVKSMDEMTIEQINEMTELFNQKMSAKNTVPKTNAERSPSSSMESSQE